MRVGAVQLNATEDTDRNLETADRLAGKVDVDRAVEIISSGAEPLRELIGAMHSKLLLAALRRAHHHAS